jgi:hypothetical protein
MLLLLLLLARAPDDRLPPLVEATPADIVVRVSRSLRAATLAEMPRPPAQPVTVTLACEVVPVNGEPLRCAPADALRSVTTWSGFVEASERFARTVSEPGGDPVIRAGFDRIRGIRVRASTLDGHADHKLMLFREIVAASDAQPPLPPAQTLDPRDLTYEDLGDQGLTGQLYPNAALRNDDMAQVALTCRIEPARTLLCRDAELLSHRGDLATAPRLFILATYQITALWRVAPLTPDGRPVVGRDVRLKVNWRLGE